MTGTIFNIQRHSIHDGPGIRTIVFLKGCPLTCVWCSNPESQAFAPQLFYDPAKCIGCGACIEACPELALRWDEADAAGAEAPGPRHPRLDRSRCTVCGLCAEVCYAEALRIEGRTVSATEVVAEVLKDKAFFERSGGGLTLSGGEPLAQPAFAAEILRLAKTAGLHTAMETAGCVPWENVATVAPHCDLFLYDIKHADNARHRALVGAATDTILANLRQLRARGAVVIVRVPVIAGFNDSAEELSAIATIAREVGVDELHLLPGHRYGAGKYRLLGEADPMVAAEADGRLRPQASGAAETPAAGTATNTAAERRALLEQWRQELAATGLTVRIGG